MATSPTGTPAGSPNEALSSLPASARVFSWHEHASLWFSLGVGLLVMQMGAYLVPAARFGARMGDTPMIDLMVGALHDPFHKIHMGITAENVAEQFGISRTMMDELAVESHRRAAAAIAEGRFKSQIVPIVKQTRKGEVVFDTDEHVRRGMKIEDLQKLRAAFKKDGSVTAGNASGLNDAAAAVVLADRAAAEKQGDQPKN